MKVKAEFIHEVIVNNAKLTPKYFYYSKALKEDEDPEKEIYEVSRARNEDVYMDYDFKIRFFSGTAPERVGLFDWHGKRI